MWTSRQGWLRDLSAWLAAEDGLSVCAKLHIRAELVLRVAMVLAAHADHASGRHCAVTNATLAQGASCSPRTVSTVRHVLATSGLAILIQQGHGSPTTNRQGWRPAIWHLVSRPAPVAVTPVCDLPPSRSDRRLSVERNYSPNARTRAPRTKSNQIARSPSGRSLRAPRPLAIQRLADELVGNAYGRTPLCHGLSRGHIGAICHALMAAGIDPSAWTARQLTDALNADMRAKGSAWPDHIERPGAFLVSRLRALPKRPGGALGGGVTAAGPEKKPQAAVRKCEGRNRVQAESETQRWYRDVAAATTPQLRQRVLAAHEARFGPVMDPFAALAGAGRRATRLFPQLTLGAGLARWAHEVLGTGSDTAVSQPSPPPPASLSAELLRELAIGAEECLVCGSAGAVQRPQLPLQSTVCDQCWPVIAVELDQASTPEHDEEMPA